MPLAYSAAGDIEPARGDEIVARVNLFSYPGSLIGAVLPGLLSASIGLPFAYVLAAVLLVPRRQPAVSTQAPRQIAGIRRPAK